ncbi:formate/nitrite transporter family protein [Aminomonas paucivorans]|uniref:Formate/nitrite transporter n=1 Tax=Aminomonas paucivorans DSM 12260 TaxID=584708 RepID=E3CXT5_9BACT|nr:formate/nitrite transporter family protein [Aminomonas paucivorans]EFQ22678.1 formate/nitrite transporter [Aminomonas paucivorans DSM 12260]
MNFKTPAELAKSGCAVAKAKCAWSVPQMLIMGILAGAYIAFGGFLNTVVTQDLAKYAGVGVTKFLGGAVFSVGLMLVVIGGAELFTGNCLMPMGVMAGCATFSGMLRNWFWVYTANLIGSLLVALLVHLGGMDTGAVGVNALKIASAKMNLSMDQAFFRGILCNWLVVMAVWMSMAAQDIVGKVFSIFFPIMAFVASGFEHSIANMYFMALGIFAKGDAAVVAAAELAPEKLASVGLGGYLHNLIPVTLGNMVGGILFVAVAYYLVFQKNLENME